jgi:hypothetical protein
MKMMTILSDIDTRITEVINGQIKNPILKRVICEEIICSNNLKNIFKEYFTNVVLIGNDGDILNHLANLLDDLTDNVSNIIKKELIQSFIDLTSDEQIFLIINLSDSTKKIFSSLQNDPTIYQILKHLLSSLSLGNLNHEYFIKFISSCDILNKNIAIQIIEDIINNNIIEIINNDKILGYLLKYFIDNFKLMNYNISQKYNELFLLKLDTIKLKINDMKLDTMDLAFEIYKLGCLICDNEIPYIFSPLDLTNKILFNDSQLEYIVKSIHTCLINNNMNQSQKILAVIYYLNDNNFKKFIEYYNDWLVIRIRTLKLDIISQEYSLWNINKEYSQITKKNIFNNYKRIINNIKFSNIINEDLSKIKFINESSNTFTKLNNVNVKLVLSVVSEHVEHHDNIKLYINNISKYIDKRTELQTIVHDTKLSKITISTNNGTIKCPLIMGSILFYLNDGNKTIKELSELMKIKESDIEERIKILMFYNVVISLPDNQYKYIEPYGTVDCEDALPASSKPTEIKYVKFTDIIMTIESRIMKEVKSKKRNKIELEQSIQEFLGSEYSRTIYYNQLESLKKRFYIEEKGDYIEYIV